MASRLRYNDRGHRYALDGTRVPSVTTIAGVLDKSGGLAWSAANHAAMWGLHNRELVDALGEQAWVDTATRHHKAEWRKAAVIGTDLHAHAESLIRTGYADVSEEQRPYVEVAADFLDRWDVQPVYTEAPVFHEDHAYAGRLDLIGDLADGNRWLLDFKTSKSGIYPEVALQAAGYRYATHIVADDRDEPMPAVDKVGAVHVRPEGWELVPVTADLDIFETFLSCQTLYRFTQRKAEDLIGDPLPHPAGAVAE